MIFNANEANISPASLDLTLSDEVYLVRGVLQAMKHEPVTDIIRSVVVEKHDLSKPMLRGNTYIARIAEEFRLPQNVYGYCNPKSSTGRLDVHVRVIADGMPRYDTVPEGYTGSLWLAISPKSFSILASPGVSLTQLRLFTGDTRLSELELEMAVKEYQLVWNGNENTPLPYESLSARDDDGSLVLTLDLAGVSLGWEAKDTDAVIDLSRIAHYAADDFFAPIHKGNDWLMLKKDHFYILSTIERIRIPPSMASEMVPMDERSGDFRSHYAGFLDPGWGWGHMGEGFGRPFTLEVRPFENLVARHGQPIAKIKFEYVTEEPDITYDTKQSHYLSQSGPRLGKQFNTQNL
jgi:dCTP deaminase